MIKRSKNDQTTDSEKTLIHIPCRHTIFPFLMGATKKICELKFFVENFSKSYFINYQKYSKDEPTEILEVIILQNLPKINNVYI